MKNCFWNNFIENFGWEAVGRQKRKEERRGQKLENF